MTFILDSREAAQHERFVQYLEKHIPGFEVKPLEVGDFYIAGKNGSAVVERKTVGDLISSLTGRLWTQLDLMKEYEGTPDVYLLVEGNIKDFHLKERRKYWWKKYRRKPGLGEANIYSMLDAIAHKGIIIAYTPDMTGTLLWLRTKAKALGKNRVHRIPKLRATASRKLSVEDQARYVLQGLFGAKTSEVLFREFNTVTQVMDNLVENPERLKEVKVGGRRIPSKVVDRAREVILFEVNKK